MNWHKLRVARLQATGAPACTHHSQGAKKHSIRIESLKFWLKKVAASACTPFRNEIRHRLGRCHRCWWPQVLLLWAHCLCCKRVAARGSKICGHLVGKHHFPKYVYYLCWLGWIPETFERGWHLGTSCLPKNWAGDHVGSEESWDRLMKDHTMVGQGTTTLAHGILWDESPGLPANGDTETLWFQLGHVLAASAWKEIPYWHGWEKMVWSYFHVWQYEG